MVLGHLLRGGSPTAFDRLAALRFGTAAVRALDEGLSGVMVSLSFPNVVYVPLAEVAGRMKGVPLDGADYLETTVIGFVDTALAAQNAVVAAESLGLGTVFVGAIRNHPEEVAAELGLPPHAVATFGLAVGVPDPTENAGIKPRLPVGAVLHRERYDADAADLHVPTYDQRLAAYNGRFGLPGNWSARVLDRLAGPQSLSGRHRLREQLERLGLPSR